MIERRRLLVGAALGVAFGPPMAMAEPADKAALLAELMKLEVASWQFLKDTNVPAVKDYLADDALLIFGDGMSFTKAEYIKAMPDIRRTASPSSRMPTSRSGRRRSPPCCTASPTPVR